MSPYTQTQSEIFHQGCGRWVTLTAYHAKPKKSEILRAISQTVSTNNAAKTLKQFSTGWWKMTQLYSVKEGTWCWSVAVFYKLLYLAAINAHIMYKQCMNLAVNRRKIIFELVKELCVSERGKGSRGNSMYEFLLKLLLTGKLAK